jgi:hypothetical protein
MSGAGAWSSAGSSNGLDAEAGTARSTVEVVAEELGPNLLGHGDHDQGRRGPGHQ